MDFLHQTTDPNKLKSNLSLNSIILRKTAILTALQMCSVTKQLYLQTTAQMGTDTEHRFLSHCN